MRRIRMGECRCSATFYRGCGAATQNTSLCRLRDNGIHLVQASGVSGMGGADGGHRQSHDSD
jgi:hypothetical protein